MSDDARKGETMRDAEIEAMIAWWDEDHDLFDENGDGIQFPDFQSALRQLRRQRDEAREVLEQAQSCILGETPEDCTHEEARNDTLEKIRKVLNA